MTTSFLLVVVDLISVLKDGAGLPLGCIVLYLHATLNFFHVRWFKQDKNF